MLGDSSRGQPILPNVKEVRWLWECNASPPLLHIIMGPQTIRLDLTLFSQHTPQHSLSNILPNISFLFPFLQHITVTSSRFDSVEIAAVSDAVCKWDRLRTVQVIGLSPTALAHVATLPCLQNFKVVDYQS